MDLLDRIMDLSQYGYFCSQIMAILLLEMTGEENPGLVRAMGGLDGGIGYSQNCCGCMTGGACLLSYFSGKSGEFGSESPEHKPMLGEFTKWFEEEMTADYGGIDCRDITGGNPAKQVELCPQIIAASFEKCVEILEERGMI